jgi:hypothetical protein
MAETTNSQGAFLGGLALALIALSVLAVVAVLLATGMGG